MNFTSAKINSWYWFLVCFIIFLGVIIRIAFIDTNHVVGDELYTFIESQGFDENEIPDSLNLRYFSQHKTTVTNVVKSTFYYDNSNGIVYSTLLHYWCRMFPNDIFYVRLLSVLFGFLSMIFLVKTLDTFFSHKPIVLFGLLLLCFNPLVISFDTSIRMYSLLLLLSICTNYLFAQICIYNRSKYWVLYVLTMFLMIYTHYLSVFLIGFHFLILFYIHFKMEKSRAFNPIFVSFVLIGMFFAYWYLFVANKAFQNMQLTNDFIVNALNKGVYPADKTSISVILQGVVKIIVRFTGLGIKSTFFVIVTATVNLFLVLTFFMYAETKWRLYLVLVLALHFFVLSAQAFSVGHNLSFLSRYSLLVYPVYILLILFAMNEWWVKGKKIVVSIIAGYFIFISLFSVKNDYQQAQSKDEYLNYTQLANWVGKTYEKDDLLLVPQKTEMYMIYYFVPRMQQDIFCKIDASKTTYSIRKKDGISVSFSAFDNSINADDKQ
ncbi:MAG: glycosyltransferase family 39 protein [Bacteroidetes bacterium]|nr:glycosyltransferase family 39 protein [Bacteroidota bacterium]